MVCFLATVPTESPRTALFRELYSTTAGVQFAENKYNFDGKMTPTESNTPPIDSTSDSTSQFTLYSMYSTLIRHHQIKPNLVNSVQKY